ncbi:leucyl/phenylalanyl-tRNA--protein transferase [Leisingera sp. ANG-M7]|uniref:leucyl/phenylalanyl-tRNA--protein transferase n=1 Tax=Leisingera sp. ANG-M7 TaxID=1577902 RepID=UPI00057CB055|nr:leucyl/phenylalanyl-tRNA--protein transferase [Leisingera sp. ANG-M7]KIC37191.1 leucyl/phenylalanyl-tRNA--protein transferase [Leisingera sp. ANG-M7]
MSLTADLLLHAYSAGVFPMAEHRDDPEVFWVDPKRRGILPLDGFRISRSLAKRIRNGGFEITVNRDFAGVVDGCADRVETWINSEIRDRYLELHLMGNAHSVEVWHQGTLAGGTYGVSLGGAFFGESMFSRRRDASKVALAYLTDRLVQAGFTLCDTQFLTPHLASLGGVEVTRARYRALLREALDKDADFAFPPVPEPQLLLQRMTQTS